MSAGGGKKKDSVVEGYEAEAQKKLAAMRAEIKAESGEGGADGNGAGATGGSANAAASTPSGSDDINIDDIV